MELNLSCLCWVSNLKESADASKKIRMRSVTSQVSRWLGIPRACRSSYKVVNVPYENCLILLDQLLRLIPVGFLSLSRESSHVFLEHACFNRSIFVGDVMFCAWAHQAQITVSCIMLHLWVRCFRAELSAQTDKFLPWGYIYVSTVIFVNIAGKPCIKWARSRPEHFRPSIIRWQHWCWNCSRLRT
jgi:hypothetical protein